MDIAHFHNTMRGEPEAVLVVFVIVAVLIAAAICLLMTILVVLSFCKIFKKAGYSWAWGLLWLVPVGNIVLLLVLAFSDWPILKELRSLKSKPPSTSSSGTTIV